MSINILLDSLLRIVDTINAKDVAEFYTPEQTEQLIELMKQTIIDLIIAIKKVDV